jgi:hypothetical protein
MVIFEVMALAGRSAAQPHGRHLGLAQWRNRAAPVVCSRLIETLVLARGRNHGRIKAHIEDHWRSTRSQRRHGFADLQPDCLRSRRNAGAVLNAAIHCAIGSLVRHCPAIRVTPLRPAAAPREPKQALVAQ